MIKFSPSPSLFRVDSFRVPNTALPRFIGRVQYTDARLAEWPGCLQHHVWTRRDAQGAADDAAAINVVTMVEWDSLDSLNAAKAAMQALYAAEGFDPAAFMAELGVRPEMGVYQSA